LRFLEVVGPKLGPAGEKQEQAPKRVERPRVTARGSSGAYNPAPLHTIAAAVPAIGRRLHSTAGRQSQRADQSIESLASA